MTTEIPDDVLAFIDHQEPKLKDRPDHFVGRVGEMRSLERMIAESMPTLKMWESRRKELEGSSPTGRMYIAAPGAGKTSILDELETRMTKEKISVIRAEPDQIKDSDSFRELIEGREPWQSRESRRHLLQAIGHGLAKGSDHLGGAGITGMALLNGFPVFVKDLKVAATALEKWLEGSTLSTRETLQLLQFGQPRGCILIVDEAQDIKPYIENQDQKEHINTVIGHLGIPARRRSLGISRATIILAGLSDTPQAVIGVGSQGIEPTVVAPLGQAGVTEMARLAIRDGSQGDDSLAMRAETAWLENIINEYGDWTRQAQAGAQAAQLLLAEFGTRIVDAEWGWEAVRRQGDRFRDNVYGGIITRAQSLGTDRSLPEEIVDAAAMALIRNGNRIGQKQMRKVFELTLKHIVDEDAAMSKKDRKAKSEEYTDRLIRSGILDRTNHLPTVTDRKPFAFYCPIPSLLQHATKFPSEWHDEILNVIRKAGLENGEPTPPKKRFRPTWPREMRAPSGN